MAFMKRPAHRVFDYPTRFYKPENDDKEKRKRKLGFSRKSRHNRKKANPIIWVIILIIVLLVYLKLSNVG